MLEISGGCFSVRLIRELDVFSVFVLFIGGASYTWVRLIYGIWWMTTYFKIFRRHMPPDPLDRLHTGARMKRSALSESSPDLSQNLATALHTFIFYSKLYSFFLYILSV